MTDAERLAGLEEHANNLEQELDAARAELANRRWSRVLRGGLPPDPNFLQLDDRELEAALSAAGAERDGDEPPGPHPPG